MGQYYKVVNLDNKEYLHPHRLGDGLKLMEFGSSGCGTMLALALLLADGNGRGGGDMQAASPLIGSWAGHRIVIAGDYADPGKWLEPGTADNLYTVAAESFRDISREMRALMKLDPYVAQELGSDYDSSE